jgi:hypothetical protein
MTHKAPPPPSLSITLSAVFAPDEEALPPVEIAARLMGQDRGV